MKSSKGKKKETDFDDFDAIGGLMVSKMVVDENIQPRFMYREKPSQPEDSGWRIFTGLETQEYSDDPDNAGIYNPSTILNIDTSIADLLLKGIGSVYEKSEDGTVWNKVTDFELEDDYMVTHKLTDQWTIEINNLFQRIPEESGDLLYTTGDRSVRITIWEEANQSSQKLYDDYVEIVNNRDQKRVKTINTFDFSDDRVSRTGYQIKESDDSKTYDALYGFSIIDQEVLMIVFYFDEEKDLEWALETWKNIKTK